VELSGMSVWDFAQKGKSTYLFFGSSAERQRQFKDYILFTKCTIHERKKVVGTRIIMNS